MQLGWALLAIYFLAALGFFFPHIFLPIKRRKVNMQAAPVKYTPRGVRKS